MGNRKRDFADTYVFDDDVLDEMECFEATSVLDDSEVYDDPGIPDDELLADIEAGTVVLDDGRPDRKTR
jgi:hypothetical protein